MKDNKKIRIIIVICAVVLLIICFLFYTGKARTDIYLSDFKVSNNGDKVTLYVGVSSSSGYVRKMKRTGGSTNYYLTFYSTYGINSKIGSKERFVLEIDENVDEIYFYSGGKGYRKVLEKKDDGEWIMITSGNVIK